MNTCAKCGGSDEGEHVFLRSISLEGSLTTGSPAMLCGWCCAQYQGREWMRTFYDTAQKNMFLKSSEDAQAAVAVDPPA